MDTRPPNRGFQAIAAASALLLLAGLIFYWSSLERAAVNRSQLKSLAVLPLQNLSADPEQEYFVEGMMDSVISDLGKIKNIRVVSRTSVMPYKTSRKSIREIAKELHADAVIEGSVMRSADRVRITVQLIDAVRDEHLWSESYERELKNVFALQGEVAQAIAQRVHAVVTPEEQKRLASKHDAYAEPNTLWIDVTIGGNGGWAWFTLSGPMNELAVASAGSNASARPIEHANLQNLKRFIFFSWETKLPKKAHV